MSDKFSKHRKVTITIGLGQTKDGGKLTEEQLANAMVTTGQLVVDAGYEGYQLHGHAGGWVVPTKAITPEQSKIQVIVEQCLSVIIITNQLDIGCTRARLTALCEQLRDLFEQTCVAVSIEELQFALV